MKKVSREVTARTAREETAAFLARMEPARRSTLTGHEEWLAHGLDEARQAWPDIALPAREFLSWLVERRATGGEGVRVADLYLACACARGEPEALRRFESLYGAELDAGLQRLRMPAEERADLRQQLRQKLLVSVEGQPPRISAYSGRGDLRRWLRAVAMREGISSMRQRAPEVGVEEGFFEYFPAAAEDLELQHIRREYRAEFKRAFERALASLEPGERNLLRQHFVDGLSTPQLAILYKLHRATAFRRLKQACDTLAARTRQALEERLPPSAREWMSFSRLIESHLDVSLARLLQSDGSREETEEES